MIKQPPKLHTIVLNVRAEDDVYSAMPIRVLKAVADSDGIPAVQATTEVDGGYLRFVEGESVRIVPQSRIEGLAARAASLCDVLLVDVPVDPDDLAASAPILDAFRTEARTSELRLKVFTMEKGELLQSAVASHCGLVLGRGLVGVIRAYDFDPMLLRFKYRIPVVESLPDDYLDQPGRPILTHLKDSRPEGRNFRVWLEGCIQHARKAPTVRTILDRP